jgi:hypothetical protein
MKSEIASQLEKIKQAAISAEKNLQSKDPQAVKKAEGQLKQVATELQAWAQKHNIQLQQHVDEHPQAEARRRCKGVIDVTVGGEQKTCVLIGKQGRNCLYSCIPATIHGLEF